MALVDDCDKCGQKELCPVYSGDSCILVKEHLEELRLLAKEAV